MVFVKFHNMNRKKKFSNVAFKLKQTQKVSLSNKSKQYYNHSSKMFSFLFFFFNLCSDVLSILLKMSVLSFFFPYAVFNNVQVSLSFLFFFFFLFLHFHCPVRFCFCFRFHFLFFFHFFFHNKLLIQCPFFFQPYIYLSVFTLTR